MTSASSDARLARRASAGDECAFAAIFRRYHQELYRFCLSILARPEDAQEALQNTMVKALRSLPGEKREIHLKPWLYRVAHNESIDLLRRRREGVDIDAISPSAPTEIAETVELRARLSHLLADLATLPTRQRSALVMRELVGLEYEQIAEALETSAAVARQTVYEARLGLRELEAGREMSCEEVTRRLSEADGRILRRRDIRAHLRSCADCRAFRDAIPRRREDLAALAPLPAVAATAILHGVCGGSAASGSALGGGTGAAVGAGAGKAVTTSVALKAAATVAVVATVGVTAADRGGLIHLGLPGDNGSGAARIEGGIEGAATTSGGGNEGSTTSPSSASGESEGTAKAHSVRSTGVGGTLEFNPAPGGSKHDSLPPEEASPATPPTTPTHGEQTSAEHKAHGTDNPGQGRTAERKSHNAHKSGKGRHHEPSTRSHEARGKGQSHAPPGQSKPAASGKGNGKAKETSQPPAEKGSAPAPSEPVGESPAAGANGVAKHGHEEASP